MKKDQLEELKKIDTAFQKDLGDAQDLESINKLKTKYLGRKADLTSILRSIKDAPKELRGQIGKNSNVLKSKITTSIEEKTNQLRKIPKNQLITNFDPTVPGKKVGFGHLHPITSMRSLVEDIFSLMGFQVYEANEVDDDYHNFESVNIPKDHPARDMWDTFWTEDGFIPITHTSSMQGRILKSTKPPVKAVILGKVFRNERTDARHEHTLYQCEGVYVDRGVNLTHMIGTLETFFENFFNTDINVRLTPDYFPFTEPSNGMELSCFICDGKGCRVCKNTGWLEILGCGMIHPNVLKEAGVDPNVYSGFAWGFGLDRLIMLKYKIEDIRHFRSGDLRFIRQF